MRAAAKLTKAIYRVRTEAAIWNADMNDSIGFTLDTLPDAPETA